MTKDKYVAMDVHAAITVIEVQDASGKVLNQTLMETKTEHLRDFFTGLSGTVHVTFEEEYKRRGCMTLLSRWWRS
jgi:hypothetical protein